MSNVGTIEIDGLDKILLTKNGVVVGEIEVWLRKNIEFVGRAVNRSGQDWTNDTHNGFAAGMAVSIKTEMTAEEYKAAQ